jgi:large subunit ribosomal protein L10
MNKQQKELVVKELQDSFQASSGAFVIGYKGMTVSQLHALRTQLRPQGGTLQVAKARLMKRAVEDLDGARNMGDYFHDQVGLVFVSGEVPAVAKLLCNYAKDNTALSVIAGCVGAHVFGKQGVEQFATLPSIDVLRAQMCGTIKAPVAGLVRVLHTSIARIVWVLNEAQKKQQ